MNFENILKEIGSFGRGQHVQFIQLCLVVIFAAFISLDITLIVGTPKHHCKISNATQSALAARLANSSANWNNVSYEKARENLYPLKKDGSRDSCTIFSVEDIDFDALEKGGQNVLKNDSKPLKCNQWNYSKDVFDKTIVNEWDLICDNQWKTTTIKTVFFAGRLVGAIVFGQISDIIGRLPTLLIAIALNIISGFGNSFAPNAWVFAVFVFLQGMVQVGIMLTSYVLANEMVGASQRKWTANIIQSFYALGYSVMPAASILLPNWRHLALLMQLPTIVFLAFYFTVYESPRWLISKGRNEEAVKIFDKIAQRNGKTLSESTRKEIIGSKDAPGSDRQYTAVDLFINGVPMALLTLNIWFNWMINALIYYGLALNVENLAGNFYLNLSLMGLLEFPAYAVSVALLDVIGRKMLLISTMALAGISCIVTGYLPKDPSWAIITVAMLGKFFVTISYGVIYFASVEIFPTVVRNIGMGMSSMSARAGGLLAAPIITLGRFYAPGPVLMFGGLALIGSVLAVALPETKGEPLYQTIEELRNKSNRKTENVQTEAEVPMLEVKSEDQETLA